MKYLSRNGDLGPELVVFTGNIGHDAMLTKLGWPRASLRSAGFLTLTSRGLYAHGESQSLGIGSLVSDSQLATAFFKI